MSTTAPTTRWIVATAGVCVTGLVGSWLLLLGPQLDAAAATRQQADDVRTQNLTLSATLAELRADHAHIEEYRAELAALRRQLPSDARLSELSREIDWAARSAGVTLVRLEATDAVDVATAAAALPVAAPPAAAAEAAPADGTTPAEAPVPADGAAAAAPDAAVAPAVPAAPPVAGMLAIPLTTTVAGSVDGVRAFLTAVQTGLERQVLVTTLAVRAVEPTTGGDGTRASAPGDVETIVGLLAYVLPAEVAPEAPQEGPLPTGPGGGSFRPSAQAAAPAAAPAPAAPAADAAAAPAPAPEATAPADSAAATAAVGAAFEQRLAEAQAAAASAAAAESARVAAEAPTLATPVPDPRAADAG